MVERVKIMPVLLTNQDGEVLIDVLKSAQAEDYPPDKRARIQSLRDRFEKEFDLGGDARAT